MNMRPLKFLDTNLSVRKQHFTRKQSGAIIGFALFLGRLPLINLYLVTGEAQGIHTFMVAVVVGILTNHNIEDALNWYLPFLVNIPHQQPVTTRADLGVVWLLTQLLCKASTIAGDEPLQRLMVAPPAVISILHSFRTFGARGEVGNGTGVDGTISSSLFNWGNWPLCS